MSDAATTNIERVVVIGAGAMGTGIAQVFAAAGKRVTLVDVRPEGLEAAIASLSSVLSRQVTKGKMTAESVEALLGRITTSTDLSEAANSADFAIEAVFERLDIKLDLIAQLDRALSVEAIIASNTSSLSITRLAAASTNPERVIGMHFFNPAPLMPLVEVVRGLQTSDRTAEVVTALAKAIGKTPIPVNDAPGFAGNRILLPMINEAIFALSEGVADRNAIDQVMKLGMGHPMGPLQLADLIGLDVCLDILEVLHRDFGDDRYRPAPLLRQMVSAGWLGKKRGRGFYHYDAGDLPVE
ncbi:MAG: 3-hydroxybutyryl-CoA dehydrogenase [Thermomicrobiales bacterium]|nr:3-hydroxybutyryl-CoA dehydrogenase [Thermomicrobiales bacterium]